jgi:site-specific recombinase XerD
MKEPSRVRVAGPLQPFARGFGEHLMRQGYARLSAVAQVQLMAQLSRWMAAEAVPAAGLTPARLEQFVGTRRAAGYRHFVSPSSLTRLVDYLVGCGVLLAPQPPSPGTPAEALVERFHSYLVSERGLAAITVRGYVRFARLLLSELSRDEELALGELTAAEVTRFVLSESRRRSAGSAKNLVAALRSLLAFFFVEGLTASPLAGAVPSVAPWHGARLPKALQEGTAARLLSSCDRRTTTGRRDFAILVLLVRLGLRAGEVAALELDDVDWRAGEVMIRGKGDRHERLPLPVDVGEAVAGYLRRGRPRAESRRLLLRVKPPIVGLTGDGVTRVVHAACQRAGLPTFGAHRLRHTAATETLRRGASLAEIGQLLRHRSAFSTAIYAKVDRVTLRGLARRWPAGVA